MIPLYKEPINSPFIPSKQTEIQEQRDGENKPVYQPRPPSQPQQSGPKGQKPLIDFQMYAPPKAQGANPQPSRDPALYMPIYNQAPYMPPQYNPFWPNYASGYGMPPIIKEYNIEVNGPMTNHSKLNQIYEDALPKRQFMHTANSLSERLDLYYFIRSVFIKHHDGEDIDLDGRGSNSLLNYLKFLDLNPYNKSSIDTNPYHGLPNDILIYRSCWPIRHDKTTGSVVCAPNSIGMNIRIYKMTLGEYMVKKREKQGYADYDMWREIGFYEYIREEILKKKLCPNFPLMYAYFICENCNIDFDKLAELKGEVRDRKQKLNKALEVPVSQVIVEDECEKDDGPVIRYTHGGLPEGAQFGGSQQGGLMPNEAEIITLKLHQTPNMKLQPNFEAYSGRGLTVLTEAPTSSLFDWASNTYKIDGNIKRMVNGGYHKSEVWFSVLFQIVAALYALQIKKIAFYDFTLEDNVYIKDITLHDNITSHWKYKVNGIDYYVPNHGYLVMVDSNYKDIAPKEVAMLGKAPTKRFKMYFSEFDNKVMDSKNMSRLYQRCFHSFRRAIDPNAFGKSFENYGGVKPPQDVLDLMKKMHDKSIETTNTQMDIGYYIQEYMLMFLHNRTGTLLNKTEIDNLQREDRSPFHTGQMVCYEVQNGTYQFVVYVGDTNNGQAEIFFKESYDGGIIKKIVPKTSLFNYSKYEKISQTFKPTESNLNEDEMIETYILNRD